MTGTPQNWLVRALFRAVLDLDWSVCISDDKTTKVTNIRLHIVLLTGSEYIIFYVCVDPYYSQYNTFTGIWATQVSMTLLSILAELNSALIRVITILLISNTFRVFFMLLRTVSNVPIIIVSTVSHIFLI